MSYFSEEKIETIQLPSSPDYWVKISTELLWKDVKKFASFKEDNVGYALDQLLQSMILEWNLDDGAGNVLEVNPENIDRLKRLDAEALVTAVGAIVQKEAPDQKKSS